MSVLSDRDIHKLCGHGVVDPYFIDNVQPASIDLSLGEEFIVFDKHEQKFLDLKDVKDDSARKVHKTADEGFTLHPGEFVLGVTLERVNMPNDIVARIEGKSSIGRLGIMVHVTAGFIDPGFLGNITLEIVNLRSLPVVLRPKKPICQLSFHRMETVPQKAYTGRYQGADGVQASRYGADVNTPFKYAGFSGPHPSLVVDCPMCKAPAGYYCNEIDRKPRDRPHDPRKRLAAQLRDNA